MAKADDIEEYRKAILDVLYDHLFKKNTEKDVVECLRTIEKISRNIIEHPDESKYCTIRTGNRTFRNMVLRHEGGSALMEAVGFNRRAVQMEETFVFEGTDALLPVAAELFDKHARIKAERLAAVPTVTKDEERRAEKERIMLAIKDDKKTREEKLQLEQETRQVRLSSNAPGRSESAGSVPDEG